MRFEETQIFRVQFKFNEVEPWTPGVCEALTAEAAAVGIAEHLSKEHGIKPDEFSCYVKITDKEYFVRGSHYLDYGDEDCDDDPVEVPMFNIEEAP